MDAPLTAERINGERVSPYLLVRASAEQLAEDYYDEAAVCWLQDVLDRTYFCELSCGGHRNDRQVDVGERDVHRLARERYTGCVIEPAVNTPGDYHPRIHRNKWPPKPELLPYRDAWRGAGISARAVSSQLARLFEVVEPRQANSNVYGHAIRQVLLLASMEVEAAWRGVLVANGVGLGRANTQTYYRLKEPMRLSEWTLALPFFEEWGAISPFSGWAEPDTTSSLPWYLAYNAVKHDRESHLDQATLGHAIAAVAAVQVMVFAQYGASALDAFEIPSIARFEIERAPAWAADEMYFPLRTARGHSRPLFREARDPAVL